MCIGNLTKSKNHAAVLSSTTKQMTSIWQAFGFEAALSLKIHLNKIKSQYGHMQDMAMVNINWNKDYIVDIMALT